MRLPDFFEYLKTVRISPGIWIVLLIVSLASVSDIYHNFSMRDYGVVFTGGVVCFAAAKATVLSWLLAVVRKVRWLWAVSWIFTVVYIVLSVVNFVSDSLFDFGVSRKMIMILSETNGRETGEFIAGMLPNLVALLISWKTLVWIVGAIFAYLVLKKLPGIVFSTLLWLSVILGMAYLVTYSLRYSFGRTGHILTLRTALSVKSVAAGMSRVKELSEKKLPLPYGESAHSQRLADKIVLVIGESASRDHHSIYGYPLPTTPKLAASKDSLYIFTDALGSSTSTSENIPRILSFMSDRPSIEDWYKYPSLMNLFKIYGYQTVWLSNQERTGEWSNLSGILSQDADDVRYLGCMDSEDHLTYRYDDVLLPDFRSVITSGDSLQLICLHLMGSHVSYENRYPKERSKFSASDIMMIKGRRSWLDKDKAATIAQYDNSIAYTDSVLSEVIAVVSRLREPAIMIYLSDHGENVYDDRDFIGRDSKFVNVPFLVYGNRAYFEKNPEMADTLANALDRPFTTADIIHSVMTLTGSDYRLYDSTRDVLSSDYKPRERYVDGSPLPK